MPGIQGVRRNRKPLSSARIAVFAALALVAVLGCEIPPPDPAIRYVCSVQVSPIADPDLVIELNNFEDDRLVDDEGNLIWDYYQCLPAEDCPECSFVADDISIPNGGAMDDHFARLVAARIEQLSGDPNSEFAQFDGWCQVPDTRECVPRPRPGDPERAEFLPEYPECTGYEVADSPLPVCEAPPPPDSCLAIDCGDGAGCTEVDLGLVAQGQEATRNVTLSNCGEAGDPVVEVSALRLIAGVNTPPDAFTLLDGSPSCLPDDPDGDRLLTTVAQNPGSASCSFTVRLTPPEPDAFSARVAFRGAVPQHEISLSGTGVSGTPAVQPELICIESQAAGGCFGQTQLQISNSGPGDLVVSELRIVELGGEPANFQLVPDGGPELPILIPPDATTVDLEIQWCDDPPADETGRLEIVTSSPLEPTVIVPLQVRDDCGPGS